MLITLRTALAGALYWLADWPKLRAAAAKIAPTGHGGPGPTD